MIFRGWLMPFCQLKPWSLFKKPAFRTWKKIGGLLSCFSYTLFNSIFLKMLVVSKLNILLFKWKCSSCWIINLLFLSLIEAAEMYSLKDQLETDKIIPILLERKVIFKINHQTKNPTSRMVDGRVWSPHTSCCIATFYYLNPDSY